jgi:four helix bundle protein
MTQFHDELKSKMDEYVHLVYTLTKKFPKEELYGAISQLRRSALSVVLNYIEGYARGREKVYKNFLEISYGSLKELKYLLHFSLIEKYMTETNYEKSIKLADDIGAMLWGIIIKLK